MRLGKRGEVLNYRGGAGVTTNVIRRFGKGKKIISGG